MRLSRCNGYLFLFCLIFLFSCTGKEESIYRKSDILMDTIVTITVVSVSPEKAEQSIEKAFAKIKGLEKELNFFSQESDIAEVNRNAGIKPVKVSEETFRLLETANSISERTEGRFDITVGPLLSLYDFQKKIRPSAELIREKLSFVGYEYMALNSNTRTVFLKKKGMMVDPGGITKGFAADAAVEVLKKEGIKSALVAVAGDIRCYGLKPDGKPWKIGIRDPRGKTEDDLIATIDLTDMAISTSGDYIRFFVEDGRRYHHIIDPKTGYPASGVISVTVIGPLAVYTDSLATAIFVSGIEKGLKTAETFGYETLMVDRNGKFHLTEGLRDRIEFIKRDH